jgi:poly(A) polymerase
MESNADNALEALRNAAKAEPYYGRLWIVGGWVRDKLLGTPGSKDIDIVLESDSAQLAQYLYDQGAVDHFPVVYSRFGVAMVSIGGVNIELVTARQESYAEDSRKPDAIAPATLLDDAKRRDFTINTLLENLHTSEIVDPLGMGRSDLASQIIRTPLNPNKTFIDDPLRMMRAVRFSSRLGFSIEKKTADAIEKNSHRLKPPVVSIERTREEFLKILLSNRPAEGIELLRSFGLLRMFIPELEAMRGCIQNEYHCYDVWDHTLHVVQNLIDNTPDASQNLRLAALFHDIAKPDTKSADEQGRVHFFGHQSVGAAITRKILSRLKMSGADISEVEALVANHMRIGEYDPNVWSNAAVRRFVRSVGNQVDALFDLHKADVGALSKDHQNMDRAHSMREKIDTLEQKQPSQSIVSPLTGIEIIEILGEASGPKIGRLKDLLVGLVIEGKLAQDDKAEAERIVRENAG